MFRTKLSRLLIAGAGTMLAFNSPALGQARVGMDAQSPAVADLAYRGSSAVNYRQVENVDPRYGSLGLHIPILRLPGRNGLDLDLAATYSSAVVDYRLFRIRTGSQAGQPDEADPRNGILEDHIALRTEYGQAVAGMGLGWTIPVGVTVIYITGLDGGTTFEEISPPYPAAAISGHGYFPFFAPCACDFVQGAACACRNILGGTATEYIPLSHENSFWTADGHYRYVGGGETGAFLADTKGSKYFLAYGPEQSFKTRVVTGLDGRGNPQYHTIGFKFKVGVTTRIQDANGNYIDIAYGRDGLIDTVTDTLDRVVKFHHQNIFDQARYTKIEYLDSEGRPQIFEFQYQMGDFGRGMRKANGRLDNYRDWSDFRRHRAVLTGIRLPNGKSWSFEYDTAATSRTWEQRVLHLGHLSKLVYPTSAYTTFEYSDQPYMTAMTLGRDGGCSAGPDNVKVELRRVVRYPNGDGRPIATEYVPANDRYLIGAMGECGARRPLITSLYVENKPWVDEVFSNGGKVRYQYFAPQCQGATCHWEPREPLDPRYGLGDWGTDYRAGLVGQAIFSERDRKVQETRFRYFMDLHVWHNDGVRTINEYHPAAHGGLYKIAAGTPFILNQKTYVGPRADASAKVSEIRYAEDAPRAGETGADIIRRVLSSQLWPGNRTMAKHYDFGVGQPGPLIRTELIEYEQDEAYKSPFVNLRALVKRNTIFRGDPADNFKLSETTFAYDRYAGNTALQPIDPGALTHHDPAAGLDFTRRGNLTHVTRWLDTARDPIETQRQFDIAGNLRAAFDALGRKTETYYTEATRFAYAEAVKNPLNHEVKRRYIVHKGLVRQESDPNQDINDPQKRSEYTYNDPLDRIRMEKPPAGSGPRELTYDDDQLKIFERQRISEALTMQSDTQLDTLGRVRRTKLRKAPEDPGDVQTDTMYDDVGRVFAISNPYFEGSQPDGWTRTCYDGAGRVVELETFSGAEPPPACGDYDDARSTGRVTTEYVDNMTLVTDQTDRQRVSIRDGLDRLVEVFEVNPEEDPADRDDMVFAGRALYGYRTQYDYDPLGNLILVCQGGRVLNGDCTPGAQRRRFVYDSLSRLVRSENPESGVVTYEYDAQGNLTERTDARGLTTHYEYDKLNRPQIKYFTGVHEDGYVTPEVVYFYDQADANRTLIQVTRQGPLRLVLPEGFEPKNTIGRLMAVKVGDDIAEFFSYDLNGRVTDHLQRIKGVDFRLGYRYDLAGNVVVITYPSGMRVHYAVNQANRVTAAFTPDSSPVLPGQNWVTHILYKAHGGKAEWTFGNGLKERIDYNTRLQPEMITTLDPTVTDRDNRVMEFLLDYGPAPSNNGNIRAISERWFDRDTGGQISQRKQFNYDPLNRLKTAQLSAGPIPWSLLYNYDRFGNRLDQRRLEGDAARVPDVRMTLERSGVMVTNRIAALTLNGESRRPAYDAAGNMTDDGERRFRFDAENQIVRVNDDLAEYGYNASNRRVYKKVGGCETRFVYGPGHKLLAEVNSGDCP